MPLIRALADASASAERSAPWVMLRASATATNNRISTRSKCMAWALYTAFAKPEG